MPRDGLAVAGQFAEEMRSPTHHVVAQQIPGERGDARVGDQVPHAPVFHVGMLHRITAATLGEHSADDGVNEGARPGNFLRRKQANAVDITLAVEVHDLRGCQHLGILDRAGMKRQVPVHVGQLFLRGIRLELGRDAHANHRSMWFKFCAGNLDGLPALRPPG